MPPAREDVSLTGAEALGLPLGDGVGAAWAEEVDGKKGSEKGWVVPD